jgi:hypothetical protein
MSQEKIEYDVVALTVDKCILRNHGDGSYLLQSDDADSISSHLKETTVLKITNFCQRTMIDSVRITRNHQTENGCPDCEDHYVQSIAPSL